MTPPARRPRLRIFLYAALAVIVLAFAGYGALWREGARAMRASIDDWIEAQRAAGVDVEYDSVDVTGFPLKLRGRIHDISIAAPGAGQNSGRDALRWQAPQVNVDVSPANPNALNFSAEGPQMLFLDEDQAWRIESERHVLSLANDRDAQWRGLVRSGPARISGPAGEVKVQALHLETAPDARDPDALIIGIAVAEAVLARGPEPAAIDRIDVAARLTASGLAGDPDAWRAAGGALTISSLHLSAEGAEASLSGVLGLDADGFPEGALQATIIRPAGLGRLLGKIGVISQEEARAVETALALMTVATGGELSVPILLADGEASLAGVKLFDLQKRD